MTAPREHRGRVRGSLLGGALGDALGAAVEFLSWGEIRARYGPGGIAAPETDAAGLARVTDDTQMTLFTAEGIVLAARAGALSRPGELVRLVHRAYLRWLRTQGETSRHPSFEGAAREGWLVAVPELHASRAPGNTCLSGLRAPRMGTREQPLNHSKGCGGVMRAAPVGLAPGIDDPFGVGCRIAALTHGHPTGQLAAGALALLVREGMQGTALADATDEALETLRREPAHEETTRALEAAVALAREAERGARPPGPEAVAALGEGWVAEEALAIALCCAWVAPLAADGADPKAIVRAGLRLAANHSGDSDSTAAIAGNLLGAIYGEAALPADWLARLELRSVLEEMADALVEEAGASPPGRAIA